VAALAKGDFETEGMQAPLTVTGSKGSVYLPNFVASGMDPRVIVESAGQKRVEHLPSISTYTYQLLAFADAIDLGKAVKTDANDAIAQSALLDAAYLSASLPLRPIFKG
jgi:predicted dehydrogenase